MKYFSAQYIYTNTGMPLKRGIIATEEDGTVNSIEDTGGNLTERHSVMFYNGIIVPGFVNCHCHLELSSLKDKIPGGTGLGGFLSGLTSLRTTGTTDPVKAVEAGDKNMAGEGIVLCADICNSALSFSIKKDSRIKYVNLLEVFGIDPDAAGRRMEEIMKVAVSADEAGLEWFLVPHSAYSVSKPLFSMLREKSRSNRVTSVHFMESEDERQLLVSRSGPLMEAYKKFLSPPAVIMPAADHVSAVLDEITGNGNLILVHNTIIGKYEIRKLRNRTNIFYCLCPGSNRYITGRIPPFDLLRDEKCLIVIGTDSLASNDRLSMLNEIRILQDEFPSSTLDELIAMATMNGARALGKDDVYGSIEPGKKPGLVLIRDADLDEKKLLPSSSAVRLI